MITTLGLDVELMATPEFARSSRRDQLGAFLDAVAAYVDVDGDASLPACSAICRRRAIKARDLSRPFPPTAKR